MIFDQAAEGARIAGASRIIGVDLNSKRFDEGEYNSNKINTWNLNSVSTVPVFHWTWS